MTAIASSPLPKNALAAPTVAVFPAPGWLFFSETLPFSANAPSLPKNAGKNPPRENADGEKLAQISLESHAPLPLEHLAYGWRADAGDLLYYATARDRLREILPDAAQPSFLLPDFLLAPAPNAADTWVWVATPHALTAVRFAKANESAANALAALPAEFRSWPWATGNAAPNATLAPTPETETENASPAKTAPANPAPHAQPFGDIAAIWRLRDTHAAALLGKHDPKIFIWDGASIDRKQREISLFWKPVTRDQTAAPQGTTTVRFPVAAAWNADIRERPWLAQERHNRAGILQINRALKAAAVLWLAVLAAAIGVQLQIRSVDSSAAESAIRAAEVAAIKAKAETLERLDKLQDGEIANKDNSFYDTLATLNHFRPQTILFTRATSDTAKREVSITGTANSMQEVSAYVKNLRTKTNAFSAVTEKSSMAAGSANFDITVTIRELNVSRGAPLSENEQAIIRTLFNNNDSASEKPPSTPAAAPAKSAPNAAEPSKSAPTEPAKTPASDANLAPNAPAEPAVLIR